MKKLTEDECWGRFQAFDECAGHMELDWSDDETENAQVPYMVKFLKGQADYWKWRAKEIEKNERLRR